jgi:hypothetical protein
MRIIEVIESKRWRHTPSGRTASIYGAVPWTQEADKANWAIETIGWTWRLDNGTIGLGRAPAATREQAEQIMRALNGR